MNLPSDHTPEDRTVKFGGVDLDERLALLIADLTTETTLDLIGANIVEPHEEDGPSEELVELWFDSLEHASAFCGMVGTCWPETRGFFVGSYGPDTWGTFTSVLEHDNIDSPVGGSELPFPEDPENCTDEYLDNYIDDDDDEDGCDCGNWHMTLAAVVFLPLREVPELTRKIYQEMYPEADAGLEGIDLEQLLRTDTETEPKNTHD